MQGTHLAVECHRRAVRHLSTQAMKEPNPGAPTRHRGSRVLHLRELTPRVEFYGGQVQRVGSVEQLEAGVIVRVESSALRRWIYCRIDRIVDADMLEYTLVESQSWPALALRGAIPGRSYLIARADILSIIPTAESAEA